MRAIDSHVKVFVYVRLCTLACKSSPKHVYIELCHWVSVLKFNLKFDTLYVGWWLALLDDGTNCLLHTHTHSTSQLSGAETQNSVSNIYVLWLFAHQTSRVKVMMRQQHQHGKCGFRYTKWKLSGPRALVNTRMNNKTFTWLMCVSIEFSAIFLSYFTVFIRGVLL